MPGFMALVDGLDHAYKIMVAAGDLHKRNLIDKAELAEQARQARAGLDSLVKSNLYKDQPALWLQQASLVIQDDQASVGAKLHLAQRAVQVSARAVSGRHKTKLVNFTWSRYQHMMVSIAFFCENHERPVLALRMLDILVDIAPEPRHRQKREAIAAKWQQPQPHLPTAVRNGISPTVVPSALRR